MAKKKAYYTELANRMVEADRDRDLAFDAYTKMYHVDWDAPENLRTLQWMRRVPSTDPHDAIAAGTRVLSNLGVKVTVQPLHNDEANKERANEVETNLSWQLKSANRRRSTTVESDVVQSSLLYSSVAVLVIDLDWQLEMVREFGGNDRKLKIARRYGRFMVNTYNPRDVHVQRSGIMTERVLLCQTRLAQEVLDEWGTRAKGLDKLAEEGQEVTYFDYMDYETRAVWCAEKASGSDSQLVWLVEPGPHGLDFLPWVALMGGSTLETEEEHKYHSMLYSVYQSGQWENKNIADTLNFSEVIARAAAPRGKEEGPNLQRAEVDYGEPNQTVKVPAGNVYTPLQPPAADPATTEWGDRLGMSMQKSTVSQILMSGDVPAGTAFASLNLMTQTAIGALKPAKVLAEKCLAEVFTLMLLWVLHSKKPLTAYGANSKNAAVYGKEFVIQPEEIDPTAIYIEAELATDAPTDRQQRANTAAMLVQIGYPKEYALEDVGVTDPLAAMNASYMERLREHVFTLFTQGQLQQQALQMQMAAQQAQMQQQMEAQQQAAQAELTAGGGAANNPAMGGSPPAMGNPNMTREIQTGQDRGGMALAEGM